MTRRTRIFLLLTVATILAVSSFGATPTSDNLVTLPSSAPQIVIPAAGSVAGGNGTFFRSEINLLNYSSHSQLVELRWLPQGSSGQSVAPRQITIAAQSGISSADFVAEVMQQTGLGAILITALSGTAIDTTAQLYATSRIYTQQPGSTGTVSQTFFTLPTSSLNSSTLSIIGLRRDAQFRANVGVVNLDPADAQTFEILAGGSTTAPEQTIVTVQPLSMQQVSLAGDPISNLQILVTNSTSSGRTTNWTAYGSSVDNVTGDSWSMAAFTAPGGAASIMSVVFFPSMQH